MRNSGMKQIECLRSKLQEELALRERLSILLFSRAYLGVAGVVII